MTQDKCYECYECPDFGNCEDCEVLKTKQSKFGDGLADTDDELALVDTDNPDTDDEDAPYQQRKQKPSYLAYCLQYKPDTIIMSGGECKFSNVVVIPYWVTIRPSCEGFIDPSDDYRMNHRKEWEEVAHFLHGYWGKFAPLTQSDFNNDAGWFDYRCQILQRQLDLCNHNLKNALAYGGYLPRKQPKLTARHKKFRESVEYILSWLDMDTANTMKQAIVDKQADVFGLSYYERYFENATAPDGKKYFDALKPAIERWCKKLRCRGVSPVFKWAIQLPDQQHNSK